MSEKQTWYGREVFLNDEYLGFFTDEIEAPTPAALEQARTRQSLGGLANNNPAESPFVRVMRGRELIQYATVAKRIPLFDVFFDDKAYRRNEDILSRMSSPQGGKMPDVGRRRVTLLDAQGFQFYMQYSKRFRG